VDKIETLLRAIDFRYDHAYARGHQKEHGCMILFRKELFDLHSTRTVYYDEEDVRQPSREHENDDTYNVWRRGTSRVTKNIALIVAVKRKGSGEKGFIVATTHLFWHPAFVYERAK